MTIHDLTDLRDIHVKDLKYVYNKGVLRVLQLIAITKLLDILNFTIVTKKLLKYTLNKGTTSVYI